METSLKREHAPSKFVASRFCSI